MKTLIFLATIACIPLLFFSVFFRPDLSDKIMLFLVLGGASLYLIDNYRE